MSIYRTAMGKSVDMSSLARKNEKVRAVGNMNVNARGDTIDAQGRIITPVTTKVTDMYSKTVGNRSAQVKANTATPAKPQVDKPQVDFAELNQVEKELEAELEDDIAVEEIKAAEKKVKK